MSFDFNKEPDQQTRPQGPIPAGSMVMVRASVRQPKNPAPGIEGAAEGKSGLYYLDMEFEVISGRFQGLKIWENFMLPKGAQRINPMSQGQAKACDIASSRLKAMLNAVHKLLPSDDSPQAVRKRNISSWYDFNGLEFPVRVGIASEPNEKNGNIYWNNTITSIVTPDAKQYDDLMRGDEFITDGPTTGNGKAAAKSNGQNDPGFDTPPTSAYSDDVPF